MLRRPSGFQLLVLQAEVHHIRLFNCPSIVFFLWRCGAIGAIRLSAHCSLLLVAGLAPPGSDTNVFFQRHSVYSQQASGVDSFIFSIFLPQKLLWTN
jgi:hypothetical protein